MVRALKLLPVVVAAVALVAGCGSSAGDVTASDPDAGAATSETPSTPTPSVTEAPLPRCAAVWVAGTALPDEFAGCRRGTRTEATSLRCESGQLLFTYDGSFFGVPGGTVFVAETSLADDPQFQKMRRACGA